MARVPYFDISQATGRAKATYDAFPPLNVMRMMGHTGDLVAAFGAMGNHLLLEVKLDVVLKETINLLEQRGVRQFTDHAHLQQQLAGNLSVNTATPNQIMLEYRHADKESVTYVLEMLGKSFQQYQINNDRKLSRSGQTLMVQKALRDPDPIEDPWLTYFAMILGGGIVGAAILYLLLRLALRGAAKVFDGSAEVLDGLNDGNWPSIEEAGQG